MTQYGVLSAWEAKQAGCKISQESIEEVDHLALEDPGPRRGFRIPGHRRARRRPDQAERRAAQHGRGRPGKPLHLRRPAGSWCPGRRSATRACPRRLKEVEAKQPAARRRGERQGEHRSAPRPGGRDPRQSAGSAGHYEHGTSRTGGPIITSTPTNAMPVSASWPKGESEKEPRWYTDGAQFLIRNQDENGSWTHRRSQRRDKTPDTAFADPVSLAFLEEEHREGVRLRRQHAGCRPRIAQGDRQRVGLRGARCCPCREWTSAAGAAADPAESRGRRLREGDRGLGPIAAQRGGDPGGQACRLAPPPGRRPLAARPASPRCRRCGNSSNLDHVPALIYALGDPDLDVACEACDALRRLTRSPGKGADHRPN